MSDDPRATLLSTLGQWATEEWHDGRVGVPYLWGGKDPDTGLDCSGAVTAAGEVAGIWPAGYGLLHNAQSLCLTLPTIERDDMQPGDLLFYGKVGAIDHVMVWIGDGSSRVIGSSGGGPSTTTTAQARAIWAGVHFKPNADYRSDLVCFGSLV